LGWVWVWVWVWVYQNMVHPFQSQRVVEVNFCLWEGKFTIYGERIFNKFRNAPTWILQKINLKTNSQVSYYWNHKLRSSLQIYIDIFLLFTSKTAHCCEGYSPKFPDYTDFDFQSSVFVFSVQGLYDVLYIHFRLRPYLGECTASRPICEVKLLQAFLVLGWETTWEPGVL
jgi:hypothetical protein